MAKAARFTMISGVLQRRSFGGPYLKCVAPYETQLSLTKLHEGDFVNHSGHRSLANQIMMSGFY